MKPIDINYLRGRTFRETQKIEFNDPQNIPARMETASSRGRAKQAVWVLSVSDLSALLKASSWPQNPAKSFDI